MAELIDEKALASLAAQMPSKGEFFERELDLHDDLPAPSLSPGFTAAVLSAYRKNKLSQHRALELLRGALQPDDLPPQDRVPLDAMHAELMPLNP